MDYLLVTYPSCDKCDALKAYLRETSLQGEELSLVEKEGKLRIREYLREIKRDEKGAIILPVFVLREQGCVEGIFTNAVELDLWLKSKA